MSSHVRVSVGAVFCVLWLIVLPVTLAAQSDATSGTIEGIVSDTTGAVLPGASVRLSVPATGFVREVHLHGVGCRPDCSQGPMRPRTALFS